MALHDEPESAEALAGRLAAAFGGEDPAATIRALSEARLAEDELTPAERYEVGRLLAQIGDQRPGVGLRNGLPDIDWVAIPSGQVLMGSDPARDPDSVEREQPQHRLTLAAFRIARYPVTVAQYAAFVDAGGYGQRAYWSATGWEAKGEATHPQIGWDDATLNAANQPVVGVSWYEAQAFCRWLGERLGQPVRLPTEAEWERAARGDDDRRYSYGDDFDATRGNSAESGIGHVCAVGLFPRNASPFGVLDLSGNVFEWTSSRLQAYPYVADDGREDPDRPGSRVFRGGAFSAPAKMARAAFRSHFYPHASYDWVGFRLCAEVG